MLNNRDIIIICYYIQYIGGRHMNYGRVILKRGNAIVLEVELTFLKLVVSTSEKLCIEVLDDKGKLINPGVLVIEPGGMLIINKDDYHITYTPK